MEEKGAFIHNTPDLGVIALPARVPSITRSGRWVIFTFFLQLFRGPQELNLEVEL